MKKLLLSAVLVATLGAATTASAADGTINFIGAITAKTCTVKLNNGTTGGNGSVTLPTVSTGAFSGLASTAGQTAFTINLSSCSTVATAATYFEPGATVNSAGRLNVTTGGATGVDLQLVLGDGATPVVVGASASGVGSATISSGSAALTYFVRYYQNSATAPTAGAANSSVAYSMIYN